VSVFTTTVAAVTLEMVPRSVGTASDPAVAVGAVALSALPALESTRPAFDPLLHAAATKHAPATERARDVENAKGDMEPPVICMSDFDQ
jgi:hypothetical protein